ncbi:MurR/RpiR family transcriptional regulator [Mesomycoplasma conjunctivae]|uniref:MurR/RpiR family transcriptional regulator n=1 Tax=Mesomycoplasma conjunctivae TaxID=45361 RepID=UPI003DA4E474
MKTTIFSQKQIESLTTAERQIIDLSLKNPVFFYNASIKELAKKSNVSMSVISLLTKKLGFASLKNMQFYVYHHYLNSKNILLDSNSENSKILDQLHFYYRDSITKTAHLIDLNSISKISETISNANKIFLYGAGSSSLAASELAINLQKLGLNATSFFDFHSFLLTSGQNQESTIILFSKSCKTKEIEFIIKQLGDKGENLIIITANKQVVHQEKNQVLIYQTLEQKQRFISISSKVNQYFVSDLIFFILANSMDIKYQQKYEQNYFLLNNWNKSSSN